MGILQSSALTLVVGALGALISLYLTYLFNRYTKKTEEYRQKREDQEAAALKKKEQDDALMLLILRIELRYIIDKTNERGYYTVDERRRYQYMYDVYKERGGNGEIERDFLKLDSLPYEKQ